MADMLRSMTFKVDDESDRAWRSEAQTALQAVAWALRTTVNASTKVSPANMVFKRNMLLNQAVKVNFETIKQYQENEARINNDRENKARKEFKYKVNSLCYIVKNKFECKSKLQKMAEGPFKITKVNNNGTVQIDRNGYREIIHIRRLEPHYRKT